MTTPNELELKLAVDPAALERLRSHPKLRRAADGEPRTLHLETRYFDTPQRDLAQRGMALRVRTSEDGHVQTLKVDGARGGGLSRRGEWEMPVRKAALDLEALAKTALGDLGPLDALRDKLRPVFTSSVEREVWSLALRRGTRVEFAIDRGRVHAQVDGKTHETPVCEAEIEVLKGTARPALAFASKLARDIALVPFPLSKAARGDALAQGEALRPVKAKVGVPADADATRALAFALGQALHALLVNVHGLGTSADNTEFVHQARVAVRRMRSALRGLGSVGPRRQVERANVALRNIGRFLGEARDWDVFCDEMAPRLAAEFGAREGWDAIETRAAERRAETTQRVRAYVRSSAFSTAVLDVEALLVRLDDDGPPLGKIAKRALRKQRKALLRLACPLSTATPAERHRIRIEGKRLRYLLDLFEPVLEPGATKALLDTLEPLQDALGEINDASVAAHLLDELPFTEGLSADVHAWSEQVARKQLPDVAAGLTRLALTDAPALRSDVEAVPA